MTVPLRDARRLPVRGWFATPGNAVLSTIVLVLGALVLTPLTRWAILDATWHGTAADCRAAGGACWTFIGHKLRFILFGLYPPQEQWRAATATFALIGLVFVTAVPRCWSRWLLVAWMVVLGGALWLMRGGLGLAAVPSREWGGLPVTLMLTTIGLAAGFPLGVLFALGRRSRSPVARVAATGIVEVVRGLPLVAVLYVAALILPLAMPAGLDLDKLVLAQAAIALFAAAYLGEAVRAGLQVVSRGQGDAALSIGLRPWQATRLILLPRALRVVLPSLVSIAVAFFQDTSLVVIIGLFDLLNTARVGAQDPSWLGFHDEAYAFVAAIYFVGSFTLSRYGLYLERLTRGSRRS
ncbi:MAG: amino acid ABC transporter permease [Gemmatimonadota bacterium]|nr:amino acid ABC transporter permease [Gemmatimonadota bacterium]